MAERVHLAPPGLAADDVSRLLPLPTVTDHAAHLERYGPLPTRTDDLIEDVLASGLRGRGGAGFPTGTKLAAVAAQRRSPVVVANGTEGEPTSGKDKALLRHAPHLILDGVEQSALALGARQAIVCVDRNEQDLVAILERAIDERRPVRRVGIEVRDAPDRYVAGEESALVHWLNGGDAKPTFVPPRPFERGVRGRPTMISNVETYAHIALVARYGPAWYRTLGTDAAPGTTLVTVTGAVRQPCVCETPGGTPIGTLIDAAGGAIDGVQAVLIGGYFGTWIRPEAVASLAVEPTSLAAVGATPGLRRDRGSAEQHVSAARGGAGHAVVGGPERGAVRPVRQRTRRDRTGRRDRGVQPLGHPWQPDAARRPGARPRGVSPSGRGGPVRGQLAPGVRRPRRSPPALRSLRPAATAPARPDHRRVAVSLTIVVNPITCAGHGLCAELFPERIRLDPWGYPIIDPKPIPAHLEAHARKAAAACPTLALLLRREDPPRR